MQIDFILDIFEATETCFEAEETSTATGRSLPYSGKFLFNFVPIFMFLCVTLLNIEDNVQFKFGGEVALNC